MENRWYLTKELKNHYVGISIIALLSSAISFMKIQC